ncbi:hypothetical protein [Carboxylicivirga sp. N1Y90]|uniref:hypothetical protein n=1 Tax=Carboxylicivirga fragile TaxID=3417571 RepID=UPI003D34A909|nr:hypothetical protein [Marinilabiliaceae bacterium N1Y90]
MKKKDFVIKLLVLVVAFFIIDFGLSTVLLRGLNKYYGLEKQTEVLFNGSSMFMSGFDRNVVENKTGLTVSNYSHEGVSIRERLEMIKQVYHKHPEGFETVVFELSPVIFSGVETSANVYTAFFPFMDDESINVYIKEFATTREYYIRKIVRTSRFDSRLIVNIIKGYLGKFQNVKTSQLHSRIDEELKASEGAVNIYMKESNIAIFKEAIDLIISKNSKVILVNMPVYNAKLRTFNVNDYKEFNDFLETYSLSNSQISYLNMNVDSIISERKYFSDPLHINNYGQKVLNSIVSEELNKITSIN